MAVRPVQLLKRIAVTRVDVAAERRKKGAHDNGVVLEATIVTLHAACCMARG